MKKLFNFLNKKKGLILLCLVFFGILSFKLINNWQGLLISIIVTGAAVLIMMVLALRDFIKSFAENDQ